MKALLGLRFKGMISLSQSTFAPNCLSGFWVPAGFVHSLFDERLYHLKFHPSLVFSDQATSSFQSTVAYEILTDTEFQVYSEHQ